MPVLKLPAGIRARLLLLVLASVIVSVAIDVITTRPMGVQELEPTIWGGAIMGVLAAIVVWRGVDVIVLRRVRAILAATSRLRSGDLSARTGVHDGRTELGLLAREFDGMASALQRQHADRVAADEQLRLSEARKSAVLEASFDGILVLNGLGVIMECNAAARAMFKCDGRRCVHHRLFELFPHELPFDSTRFNRPTEVFETEGRRLDQSSFSAEMSIAPIRDPAAQGLFVATVRDITERKRLERRLESLSFEDELTHLYNRRGFLMFASQHLKLAQRSGQSLVLVSVDLDGLKCINDHFGHANGDRAIIELANALRASFRDSDVIGRMGGDEFVVMALESDQKGAELALERLAMRIAGRNAHGDLPWTLSASIGWMRIDSAQGFTLTEMLARADERMYAHKRRRIGHVNTRLPSLEPEQRSALREAGSRALTAAGEDSAPDHGAFDTASRERAAAGRREAPHAA